MKIRDIKVYRLAAALAEPFAYSQAWYEHRGALLVEIVGEDGLSGWGEAFGPPPLTAPIVEFYKTLWWERMPWPPSFTGKTSTTGCATMARRDWP
jgi:L-alanine-DL-glutamate epimerase-like enolase superfamily enzyme